MKLKGNKAIEAKASNPSVVLNKYADPTQEGLHDISIIPQTPGEVIIWNKNLVLSGYAHADGTPVSESVRGDKILAVYRDGHLVEGGLHDKKHAAVNETLDRLVTLRSRDYRRNKPPRNGAGVEAEDLWVESHPEWTPQHTIGKNAPK